MGHLPTARLDIVWPAELAEPKWRHSDARGSYAANLIYEFAADLWAKGERAWFEVWYPADIEDGTGKWFTALEVFPDGLIVTLPPYSDLI